MTVWREVFEDADDVERGLLILLLPAWPFIAIYWAAGLLGRLTRW